MIKDKFSAVWVSHSSMGDYLKCPRAYYLNNVYRDPKTNHKINLMQPPLALGQAVHGVIESLSLMPQEQRFRHSLQDLFAHSWEKVSGKFGGFKDKAQEVKFKTRGEDMISRLIKNPGPLQQKAIKIRQELPYFWLSEVDNIILCGKIDWLEYLPDTDSVHIIDFKTGKFDEDEDSLQLPIYLLLVMHCQNRPVTKASYWYLERDDAPCEVNLPDEQQAYDRVMEIAKKIALARKLEHFKCRNSAGCIACIPLEKVVSGLAEFIGVSDFNQDVYVL